VNSSCCLSTEQLQEEADPAVLETPHFGEVTCLGYCSLEEEPQEDCLGDSLWLMSSPSNRGRLSNISIIFWEMGRKEAFKPAFLHFSSRDTRSSAIYPW